MRLPMSSLPTNYGNRFPFSNKSQLDIYYFAFKQKQLRVPVVLLKYDAQ